MTPKTIAVVENFKLKVAVLPDSISKIMSKSIEKVTQSKTFSCILGSNLNLI